MTKHPSEVEPIRGSVAILAIKLIAILIIFDVAHFLISYFLTLQFTLPFDLHSRVSLLLLFLDLIKIILQIYFTLFLVLSWSSNIYYLTRKHLIKREGFIGTKEKIYDFDNIRSITVNQSLLGKLFNFGTIYLSTSASGGYQAEISLENISDPQKYEQRIKECCS